MFARLHVPHFPTSKELSHGMFLLRKSKTQIRARNVWLVWKLGGWSSSTLEIQYKETDQGGYITQNIPKPSIGSNSHVTQLMLGIWECDV